MKLESPCARRFLLDHSLSAVYFCIYTSNAWRYIFASMGLTTPPTKLQPLCFGAGLLRICIHSKDDIHAVRGHFHPLDQGTNHLAFAKPVRVLQPRINPGRKVLQASNDQTNFRLKSRHINELLTLLLQLRETLAQA